MTIRSAYGSAETLLLGSVNRTDSFQPIILMHNSASPLIIMPNELIAAGDFKAKCLKLMDLVHRTRQPLVITKRGKPVVRLEPFIEESAQIAIFGCMQESSISILGEPEPSALETSISPAASPPQIQKASTVEPKDELKREPKGELKEPALGDSEPLKGPESEAKIEVNFEPEPEAKLEQKAELNQEVEVKPESELDSTVNSPENHGSHPSSASSLPAENKELEKPTNEPLIRQSETPKNSIEESSSSFEPHSGFASTQADFDGDEFPDVINNDDETAAIVAAIATDDFSFETDSLPEEKSAEEAAPQEESAEETSTEKALITPEEMPHIEAPANLAVENSHPLNTDATFNTTPEEESQNTLEEPIKTASFSEVLTTLHNEQDGADQENLEATLSEETSPPSAPNDTPSEESTPLEDYINQTTSSHNPKNDSSTSHDAAIEPIIDNFEEDCTLIETQTRAIEAAVNSDESGILEPSSDPSARPVPYIKKEEQEAAKEPPLETTENTADEPVESKTYAWTDDRVKIYEKEN